MNEEKFIDEDEFTVMNLVYFVRRLAYQARKNDPENKPAAQALAYLERHGCVGNVLRSTSDAVCECLPLATRASKNEFKGFG